MLLLMKQELMVQFIMLLIMFEFGKYVFEMNRSKKKNFFLKGILIEFIVTFILVTVILMVALDTKSKTGLAPILIGFTLAVNILAV